MAQEQLLISAQKLEQPQTQVAEEFSRERERLAAAVNQAFQPGRTLRASSGRRIRT